jgi:CDP-paratose 2-epimerase
MKTIVFRQSCIYGPHQFGIEDQGWVAWFSIRALQNLPVTIYGDGKQVRDVLFISDLISAIDLGINNIEKITGQVYNIGGGPKNTLSLIELISLLNERLGLQVKYTFGQWRPGDQLAYISDIRKARAHFGWEPLVSPVEGVARLVDWLKNNRNLFEKV